MTANRWGELREEFKRKHARYFVIFAYAKSTIDIDYRINMHPAESIFRERAIVDILAKHKHIEPKHITIVAEDGAILFGENRNVINENRYFPEIVLAWGSQSNVTMLQHDYQQHSDNMRMYAEKQKNQST